VEIINHRPVTDKPDMVFFFILIHLQVVSWKYLSVIRGGLSTLNISEKV